MRLLLDTHIYLWALNGSPRLSVAACDLIEQAEEVYVSAASLWEAAIKIGLGRLQANMDDLIAGITLSGFRELPVMARHAARLAAIADHHKDPFDRLLISQALEEPLRLLTVDTVLAQYSDLVILV